MKKILLIVCMLLIVSCVTVNAAEPNEWKNKNYNWSGVKNILVVPLDISKDVTDMFASQKAVEIIYPEIKKLNANLITLVDVARLIKDDTGVDVLELAKQDEKKAREVFLNGVTTYADVVMKFTLYQMGWTKEYVPPRSFTYTTNRTSHFNVPFGPSGTITTPVQNQVNIPGGYKDFPTASLGVIIYDSKTTDIVWGYVDFNSERRGGFLNSRKNMPEDNLKVIVGKVLEKIPIAQKPSPK